MLPRCGSPPLYTLIHRIWSCRKPLCIIQPMAASLSLALHVKSSCMLRLRSQGSSMQPCSHKTEVSYLRFLHELKASRTCQNFL